MSTEDRMTIDERRKYLRVMKKRYAIDVDKPHAVDYHWS